MRLAVTRNGGNMADVGSVSYLFSRKGIVILDKAGRSEDDILDVVLDSKAPRRSTTWATSSRSSPSRAT